MRFYQSRYLPGFYPRCMISIIAFFVALSIENCHLRLHLRRTFSQKTICWVCFVSPRKSSPASFLGRIFAENYLLRLNGRRSFPDMHLLLHWSLRHYFGGCVSSVYRERQSFWHDIRVFEFLYPNPTLTLILILEYLHIERFKRISSEIRGGLILVIWCNIGPILAWIKNSYIVNDIWYMIYER